MCDLYDLSNKALWACVYEMKMNYIIDLYSPKGISKIPFTKSLTYVLIFPSPSSRRWGQVRKGKVSCKRWGKQATCLSWKICASHGRPKVYVFCKESMDFVCT